MPRVLHFLPVHAPQLPGDTHASSPSSALSSAGICGHCSQRLPPPLLDVTGCRAAAARLGLHSHKDSTLFYFYTSTQMCLSGSCFSGNLYLLSFPGLFSHACHPFPSRTYCSLTKGFLNQWLTVLQGNTSLRQCVWCVCVCSQMKLQCMKAQALESNRPGLESQLYRWFLWTLRKITSFP